MARPRGSGLNVVRKRRVDGSCVEYFYDRSTGKPLGHDRVAALRAIQASAAVEAPAKDTFDYLITRYLSRPEFRLKLAPRTQQLYRAYLDEMRTRWGDLPFRAFDAGSIEEIKAEFQDRPRKANQIIALFRIHSWVCRQASADPCEPGASSRDAADTTSDPGMVIRRSSAIPSFCRLQRWCEHACL